MAIMALMYPSVLSTHSSYADVPTSRICFNMVGFISNDSPDPWYSEDPTVPSSPALICIP